MASSNKGIIGAFLAVAVIGIIAIGYFSLQKAPTPAEDAVGAVGAADRYRTEQITAEGLKQHGRIRSASSKLKILGTAELGEPVGVKSYKPYHSTGEDYLHNYLGMCGVPMNLVPEFPTDVNMVFLAETAEVVIGLTVVAVGTSLPELVTVVQSARRGETDLSLRTISPFGLLEPLLWLLEMTGYPVLL